MSIRRPDEEFDDDVLATIWDARDTPDGGIVGQEVLASMVRCSKARLNRRLPIIVEKSRIQHPGFCLQVAPYAQGADGRPPHRYRIADEQTARETERSQVRTRSAQTQFTRAGHELDVLKAGPGAKAASVLIQTIQDLTERVVELLEPETV